MGRLTRYFTKLILDFEELKEIRKDWVPIYRKVYKSDEFNDRFDFRSTSRSHLEGKAITSSEKAVKFSNPTARSFEYLESFISDLKKWFIVISVIFGFSSFSLLQLLASTIANFYKLAISTIPLEIGIVLWIWFWLLTLDDDFIQEFNYEMRFGADDISRKSRNRSVLFSYHLWNEGLCDKRMPVTLVFLYLVKTMSERMYAYLLSTIFDNIEEFAYVGSKSEIFKISLDITQD